MLYNLVDVQVICIHFLKIACYGISTGQLASWLVLILILGSLIDFSGTVKGNNSDENYLTVTTLSLSYIQKFSATHPVPRMQHFCLHRRSETT